MITEKNRVMHTMISKAMLSNLIFIPSDFIISKTNEQFKKIS